MTAQPGAYYAGQGGLPAFFNNPQRACARPSVDPGLFHPGTRRGGDKAKAICARCPFWRDCGEWALANPDVAGSGIFGGTNEADRDVIRARRDARKGRAA